MFAKPAATKATTQQRLRAPSRRRTEGSVVLTVGVVLLSGVFGACNAILGFAEGESMAGSSGTGGGGSDGSAGAGTAGGGAFVGGEDCLNGVDDDGDLLADCADPKCTTAGFACVPAAGAEGPGFARSRPIASPTATCPAGFSRQIRYDGLTYDPLTCTCGCGTPSSASCSVGGTGYLGAGCTGTSHGMGPGCNSVNGDDSYQAWVNYNGPGACQPTVESSGVPGTAWTTAFDICLAALDGAGCELGSVCTPPAPPDFSSVVCTLASIASGCPGAYEEIQLLGSEDIVDGRTCATTGCNCAAASGQTCTARGGVVSGLSCGAGGTYVGKTLGPCEPISGQAEVYLEPPTSSGGFCPSSGNGAVEGAVQAAEQHALCCLPSDS